MKARGILYSTPMIIAKLKGSKTMTRRIIKGMALEWLNDFTPEYVSDQDNNLCPYGKIGDLLYAREGFQIIPPNWVFYKADPENTAQKGWKPSIHMPKEAARIIDQIVSIKAERVQDISIDDIIKEGLTSDLREHDATVDLKEKWFLLWWSINGLDSWNSNPWVWVIETKTLSTTGWSGLDPKILSEIETKP
jgi:hypothetical protein